MRPIQEIKDDLIEFALDMGGLANLNLQKVRIEKKAMQPWDLVAEQIRFQKRFDEAKKLHDEYFKRTRKIHDGYLSVINPTCDYLNTIYMSINEGRKKLEVSFLPRERF
jgi:hypothetical protein